MEKANTPRNLFQYFIISLKGIAMGAADVVPGVSGGTIAFVTGIYEELIATIHSLDLGFFTMWKKEGFKASWSNYNLNFLLALGIGIAVSILSLAKLISHLLETYPIAVWSFFFGLILASILYVAKQITKWSIGTLLAILIGSLISYLITIAEPLDVSDSIWFLFFAGSIAIIAMILPGISGAFILLLLGAYELVLGTVSQFIDSLLSWNTDTLFNAFLKILVFSLGAIVGLKLFSRALNWMFAKHKNLTLAILTGFMIGALNKIWPWKDVISTRVNSKGVTVPFIEKSILPSQFDGNPQIVTALLLCVVGFLLIFILEKTAQQKTTK